jgi:basic membrane protein A
MKHNSFWRFVALTLVLVFALSACKAAPTATNVPETTKKLKIALVHYGPFNDQGWGQTAYEGFKKAADELGAETALSESVPPAEYEAVMLDYGAKGFDLVVANANDMEDAVKVAAAAYPNTFYVINSGRYANTTNVASIAIAEWQEGYYGGTIAAYVTKTNKIAFIGGQDIPIIVTVEKGFKAAALAVNPNVDAEASYVGSWTDIQKAKELTSAFLDQGFDVIMAKADGGQLAALTEVNSRGVLAVGSTGDMNAVQPDNVVASARSRNEIGVYNAVTFWAKGELPAGIYNWGAKEGVVDLVWNEKFKAMYPELVTLIEQVDADLKSGKITEPQ